MQCIGTKEMFLHSAFTSHAVAIINIVVFIWQLDAVFYCLFITAFYSKAKNTEWSHAPIQMHSFSTISLWKLLV